MRSNVLILIGACCLFGCEGTAGDPNSRYRTWMPEHNNDTNLQAMIANPTDLQRGHGDGAALAATAANAIDRLRADKVKPLPSSDISDVKVGNSGAAGGAQ